MIEEYIMIKGERLSDLVEHVNKFMADGYQPFGSMTFVPTFSDNSGKLFVQPMVKYTKEAK